VKRILKRAECIVILALYDLARLDSQGRDDLLLNFWPPDEPHFLLDIFPYNYDYSSEMYPQDPNNPQYNPILIGALASDYKGVSNEFLEFNLEKLHFQNITIVGEVESLHPCPCCAYKTLDGQSYSICKICLWEDDGTTQDDIYSSPNHSTLADYRRLFFDKPLSYEQSIRYLKKIEN
jgi:hypothetical protein